MKERIIFPDIARGIAILVVIMWHTIDYHNAWVDSWALPVFFVIMGMFFRPTATWGEMITKKARAILLPFLILSIPSFIQYALQLPIKDFVSRLLDPFNCMHGVGWFLICMFWCYLIYYGIHRLTKGNLKYKFIISLLLSASFFYISTLRPSVLSGHRLVLPLFISTSFTCTILICFGEILRDMLQKERFKNRFVLPASVAMGGQ